MFYAFVGVRSVYFTIIDVIVTHAIFHTILFTLTLLFESKFVFS